MPNIKEQLIDIKNDIITTRIDLICTQVRINRLCSDYEEIIRNLHLEAIKSNGEVVSLQKQLRDLQNRHSELMRRSTNAKR